MDINKFTQKEIEQRAEELRMVSVVNEFRADCFLYGIDTQFNNRVEYDMFDKCVKELSEAAWMNNGEPMHYDRYKRAYSDAMEAESVLDEVAEWKNGDECVIDG